MGLSFENRLLLTVALHDYGVEYPWSIPSVLFCHLFTARKEVKPTIQPLYSSKPVPDGASSLLQVRHRGSGGSKRQCRVRQAAGNSVFSHGADEAVSVPNILYAEDPKYYDSFPAVIDFYSAQDNAVRFWHSPIT